jgi:hypothetical protein
MKIKGKIEDRMNRKNRRDFIHKEKIRLHAGQATRKGTLGDGSEIPWRAERSKKWWKS